VAHPTLAALCGDERTRTRELGEAERLFAAMGVSRRVEEVAAT